MDTLHDTEPVVSTGEMSRRARGVAGAVAVAVALAISELMAGLLSGVPSLVSGVASFVIDVVPKPIKDWAIRTFGIYDKVALAIGIVVAAIAIGGLIRRRWATPAFLAFGALGALATARSPQVTIAPAALNGAVSALAGIGALSFIKTDRVDTDADRRRFLVQAGGLLALAGVVAAGGRYLGERARQMLARREEVVLPIAVETATTVGPANEFQIENLAPIVMPNDRFYRIDTAPFNPPQVDLSNWELKVTGMVGRPITLGYDAILEMPLVERYVTLSCVSNEVGGRLVGNALWLGYPLADLLNRAGVQPGAQQVVGRSVDGFTVGFPVEAAFDGREALLAVGMNGEPLPFDHGFPARLVVAGLYGYVSATKWLSEIELTTWDGFDAYWIPRGWAKEAPIKTQSRIDTPRGGSWGAGAVPVAGVAWAPDRGISLVEIRVDGGQWMEAELSKPLSKDAWVQWKFAWNAEPGDHVLQVRATDGDGVAQVETIRPPAPDGATGYHTVQIQIV